MIWWYRWWWLSNHHNYVACSFIKSHVNYTNKNWWINKIGSVKNGQTFTFRNENVPIHLGLTRYFKLSLHFRIYVVIWRSFCEMAVRVVLPIYCGLTFENPRSKVKAGLHYFFFISPFNRQFFFSVGEQFYSCAPNRTEFIKDFVTNYSSLSRQRSTPLGIYST